MAHKRLEAAILAGHDIGVGDYGDLPTSYRQLKYDKLTGKELITKAQKLSLPLDRWGVYCVKYSHDGKDLAVGFGNGGIIVIDSKSGVKVHDVTHGHRKGLAVMALQYMTAEKDRIISAGASGRVNLWEPHVENDRNFEPSASIHEENNEINALDVCQDGNYFATAGKDRNIRLYDANTFKLHRTIVAPDYINMDEVNIYTGHTKRIFALKFHPEENNLFLTAGWDDCVKLWDKRIPRSAKHSIPGPHICGAALDVRGNQILTGSWSAKNSLQIWDMRSGFLDKTLPFPHDEKSEGEFLYCAKFVNSSSVVAGGSGTNSACVVNLNTEKLHGLVQSKKPVLTLDTCNNGKQLAVGGIGGNLQLTTAA